MKKKNNYCICAVYDLSLLQQLESNLIPRMKQGQISSLFPPGALPSCSVSTGSCSLLWPCCPRGADPAVKSAMAVPGGRAAAAARVTGKRKLVHMKVFLSPQTQPPASLSSLQPQYSHCPCPAGVSSPPWSGWLCSFSPPSLGGDAFSSSSPHSSAPFLPSCSTDPTYPPPQSLPSLQQLLSPAQPRLAPTLLPSHGSPFHMVLL